MTGWDYREATTKELADEISTLAQFKGGYERLLADVVADRLYLFGGLEDFIRDQIHCDGQYDADYVYEEFKEFTLGEIAENIAEYSKIMTVLLGFIDHLDPQDIKKRIKTKYEEKEG